MIIGVLTLQFHLPGCRSLKEKRRRLIGIRDKYGKTPTIAVCESGLNDQHQKAQWSFVTAANEKRMVESSLAKIEDAIALGVDAVIMDRELEFL